MQRTKENRRAAARQAAAGAGAGGAIASERGRNTSRITLAYLAGNTGTTQFVHDKLSSTTSTRSDEIITAVPVNFCRGIMRGERCLGVQYHTCIHQQWGTGTGWSRKRRLPMSTPQATSATIQTVRLVINRCRRRGTKAS